MAVVTPVFRRLSAAAAFPWRGVAVAALALAVAWGGIVYAANNSVQGATKEAEELGFDGDAPTAILIEASSGSVLFEKNADELRAPSSMMKLMTAEVVFHAIKQGDVKLTDEYRDQRVCLAQGRRAGWRLDDVCRHPQQQDFRGRSAARRADPERQRCLHRAGGGNCRHRTTALRTDYMTKRARELGLTQIDLCQFQRPAQPRQQDDGA